MPTLGSSTTADFMGIWLVEGSDGTSWISNNSPNSMELSGLTEGQSYIKLIRLDTDNLNTGSLATSWQVGNGVKNEFTYGDDEHVRAITAKLTGATIAAMHAEKAKIKRFKKRANRGSADNVYMFNRYASSANGFELFYNNAQAEKNYAPVLIRGINYLWSQATNKKTTALLTVEEIWRA